MLKVIKERDSKPFPDSAFIKPKEAFILSNALKYVRFTPGVGIAANTLQNNSKPIVIKILLLESLLIEMYFINYPRQNLPISMYLGEVPITPFI